MQLHWLDTLVLLAYLAGILGMGYYFSRKNTNTEEYFVGGRSFSGWVIGLSLVGTSISSITFLAYPGDAYKTTWLRYLPNLMLPIGILIAAYVFLPFFRRRNTITAYQFLEERFGPSVRVYGAVAFIIAQLVRISIILFLLSLLIHEMTGLEVITCILIGGLFVAVYTIMGGIDAVIWTDVIQTLVLLIGGLLCIGIIIDQLPGGFSQILSQASAAGKFSFSETAGQPSNWQFSLSEKTASMMLIVGLTGWLTEYSSNQNTVQRYVAAKSSHEARKAMFVCALSSLPIWAFYMLLGTSLYVFFQNFPTDEAIEMLNGERKAEQILPYFIMNYLPKGMVGLVIAAALAAAMSSLDSSINSISTTATVDIYRRHFKQQKTDKHYLKAAWIFASISAVFMIIGAIVLAEVQTSTIQDTAMILTSLLGGGLLGMYLLGFLTKKGDARAVWCGIAFTMVFTTWTILAKNNLLPPSINVPFDLYYTGFIGNIVMFICGYAVGAFFPKESTEQQPVLS